MDESSGGWFLKSWTYGKKFTQVHLGNVSADDEHTLEQDIACLEVLEMAKATSWMAAVPDNSDEPPELCSQCTDCISAICQQPSQPELEPGTTFRTWRMLDHHSDME